MSKNNSINNIKSIKDSLVFLTKIIELLLLDNKASNSKINSSLLLIDLGALPFTTSKKAIKNSIFNISIYSNYLNLRYSTLYLLDY